MSEREKRVLESVIGIIIDKLNPGKIILFGSRVKGSSKYYSDFDLAVDIEKPESRTQRILKDMIEDVSGLYTIDVVYLGSVDKAFKNIVLKSGKVLYER